MLKIAALCMLAWCQTIAAAQLVSAVVYNTSVPPHAKLPIYDHGYLIVTYGHGDSAITAYGPDGSRIFDGLVKLPSNAPLEIGNAAADTDGTVAVTVTYTGPEGHGGAIVLFNRIGHQTHVIETGRYLPAALAFDSHRDLWAAGWQRETQDYFIFRKFSPTGTEAGAFVRRSAFPAGLEPGHIPLGEKGVSVADGRVGALLESGNSADAREWVELDLAGKLVGRWPMPHMFGINVAFASDGSLYGDTPYAKGKPVHLTLFDRSSGAWKTVPDEIHADWTLMGAQGSDVVVWDRGSDPMLLRCWRPSR